MRIFAFLSASPLPPRNPVLVYALGNLVIGFLLLLLLGGFASAQTVTPPPSNTVFDFGPWLDALLDLLAPAILGVISLLGLALMQRVTSWLGLRIEADQRAALNQGLENGVNLALEKLKDRARNGISIDLKSEAIATVAGYAQRSYPDAIKAFGIDKDRLAEMAESRLEGWLFDPAVPESRLEVISGNVVSAPIS